MSFIIDKFNIKMSRGFMVCAKQRSVPTAPVNSTLLDLSSDTWYLIKYILSRHIESPVELVDVQPIYSEHLNCHLEYVDVDVETYKVHSLYISVFDSIYHVCVVHLRYH